MRRTVSAGHRELRAGGHCGERASHVDAADLRCAKGTDRGGSLLLRARPLLLSACAAACVWVIAQAVRKRAVASRRDGVLSRYDRQEQAGEALRLCRSLSSEYAQNLRDALVGEASGADACDVLCDLSYEGPDEHPVIALAWPPGWHSTHAANPLAPEAPIRPDPMLCNERRVFLARLFAWYADQASIAACRRLYWVCASARVRMDACPHTRSPLPLASHRHRQLMEAIRNTVRRKWEATAAAAAAAAADNDDGRMACRSDPPEATAYFIVLTATRAFVLHGTHDDDGEKTASETDFEMVLCLLPRPSFFLEA